MLLMYVPLIHVRVHDMKTSVYKSTDKTRQENAKP